MGQLSGFSYREIIARLKKLCFSWAAFPNHGGDMPQGTLKAILQQAGVTPEEFLNP